MVKYHDQYTSLGYLEELLTYLALHGWCDISVAIRFNLVSTTDKQRNTHTVYYVYRQNWQDDSFILLILQQVHNLRETYVGSMCSSIEQTFLKDVLVDFKMVYCRKLFSVQIWDSWWQKVTGLVFSYNQTVLIDCRFITLQNGLLDCSELFDNPTLVEYLRFNCKIEFSYTNHRIIPEAHNNCIPYIQSEANRFNNSVQG